MTCMCRERESGVVAVRSLDDSIDVLRSEAW